MSDTKRLYRSIVLFGVAAGTSAALSCAGPDAIAISCNGCKQGPDASPSDAASDRRPAEAGVGGPHDAATDSNADSGDADVDAADGA